MEAETTASSTTGSMIELEGSSSVPEPDIEASDSLVSSEEIELTSELRELAFRLLNNLKEIAESITLIWAKILLILLERPYGISQYLLTKFLKHSRKKIETCFHQTVHQT
jgi:hypothetical protein